MQPAHVSLWLCPEEAKGGGRDLNHATNTSYYTSKRRAI